jgi:hypothetical protein
MADAKTRKQRMRERRQQAGLKAELVWLTPEAQAAMAALRQPGETIDAVVNRALITLQGLTQAGAPHVPSRGPSHKGVPSTVPSHGTIPTEALDEIAIGPKGVPSHVPSHVPSPTERPSYETYRATILQRIAALRAQQSPVSWQQIADAFNQEGLATLSGRGKWDKSTVASLWKKYGEGGNT